MNDYERVARMIRFLDAERERQPSLELLASRAGLNRFYVHRLFTRWAGVTPKDFLQCLTLEHARERLRRGESVLSAALETGLSSPGRLHDLCVTLEAATPGEIKSGGEGWTIRLGFAATPFGVCCIGEGPRGVCHLAFVENQNRITAAALVKQAWPRARLVWDNKLAEKIGSRIFHAGLVRADRGLRAVVRATPFQLRVWRALLRVPPGALISYGSLAAAVGSPAAARAVGTAVGSNPLAYLIPCHRVIRETGVVGEYRWGHERKRLMLGWEGANAAPKLAPGSRLRLNPAREPAS